jgi:hypothetical protein
MEINSKTVAPVSASCNSLLPANGFVWRLAAPTVFQHEAFQGSETTASS